MACSRRPSFAYWPPNNPRIAEAACYTGRGMSSGFKTFKLLPELQQAIDEAGYGTPTPIQVAAIPLLLEGRDLVGVAETGTGKTLAYLLPILQRLGPPAPDPRAL